MADQNEKLELVVLLFVRGSKEPPTSSEAGRALKSLLAHLGATDAKTALESALESCVSAGTVKADGTRTLRFGLTPDGERRLEAEFGPLPKASWPELRDRFLVPRCVTRSCLKQSGSRTRRASLRPQRSIALPHRLPARRVATSGPSGRRSCAGGYCRPHDR